MQSAVEVSARNREGEDVTYTVTTFPANKGLKYLQKLLKVVGPAVGELFAKAAAEGEEGFSIEDEALALAIRELSGNFDKENIAQLVQDMIKDAVTLNGQPIQFGQEFAANYGVLMKLIGAIVKENYSSFFGEDGLGELQSLIPRPSSSKE